MQSKTAGEVCEAGGQYCCLYHLKNKIKIKKDVAFPRCDFAGLNCEGTWHLLKEIKEKTREEIMAANNHRRDLHYKHRSFDHDYMRKLKEPKYNKWDFERW